MEDTPLLWIFATFLGGLLTYLLSTAFLHLTEGVISSLWLRTYGKGKHKGFVFRVRVTLYLCRFSQFLPFLHSVMGTILLAVFLPAELWPWIFLIAFFVGFWVAPLFLAPAYVTRRLPRFSLMLSILAAKRLVAFASHEDQEKVLGWAARSVNSRTVIAAANGYMETTEIWALKELEEIAKHPDRQVKEAANEAIALLHAAVLGSGPMSLAPMEKLIHAYATMENALRFEKLRVSGKKTLLAGVGEKIDNIVYSQLKLREGFPHLFCRHCLARPEAQTFREWEWVRCRHCKDVSGLVTGVEQVIGQIGGDEDWKLANGVLEVRIWDAWSRQARAAQIDALMIIGGEEMDYDWAVGAVVQRLQNLREVNDPPVSIRLVKGPQLAQNSVLLLKSLNPAFEGEG